MTVARGLHPAPALETAERPERAPPEGRRRRAGRPRRGAPSAPASTRRLSGTVRPWKRFQVRTRSRMSAAYSRRVRVLLLDPAAYTLPYDHHLATALAGLGSEVELVSSRFRFGDAPMPDGLPAAGALLPGELTSLQALAPAPAAQGRGARSRARPAPRGTTRRPPRPVGAAPAGRRAPAPARRAVRDDRARHPAHARTASRPRSGATCTAASIASSCTASMAARRLVEEVGVDPARILVDRASRVPGHVPLRGGRSRRSSSSG